MYVLCMCYMDYVDEYYACISTYPDATFVERKKTLISKSTVFDQHKSLLNLSTKLRVTFDLA